MKGDWRIGGWSNRGKQLSFVLLFCFHFILNVLSERQVAFVGSNTRSLLGPTRCKCEPYKFAKCGTRSQQFSTAKEISAISSEASSQHCFPDYLIRSLDLAPLIRLVARHATTRRGYRAILSLVNEEDKPSKNIQILGSSKQHQSSRQKRAAGLTGGTFSSQTRTETLNRNLVSIAASSDEARQAYELVEQATLALQENPYNLTFPPLYGQDSNPMDMETIPVTDDDEWLYLAPDDWTLESIIQAEQVIDALQNVRAWAALEECQEWMPALSEMGLTIDPDGLLQEVHNEIIDVVEIVRARTAIPTAKGVSLQLLSLVCPAVVVVLLSYSSRHLLFDSMTTNFRY